MKIELEAYDHTCADGCCYTYGYDVFVDGEKIGSTIGDDAYELAELLNEYFNTNQENLQDSTNGYTYYPQENKTVFNTKER